MSDEFTVDTAVEFNDDQTVNIHFNEVALEDVQFLFDSIGTPEFQENFINGLINAKLAR